MFDLGQHLTLISVKANGMYGRRNFSVTNSHKVSKHRKNQIQAFCFSLCKSSLLYTRNSESSLFLPFTKVYFNFFPKLAHKKRVHAGTCTRYYLCRGPETSMHKKGKSREVRCLLPHSLTKSCALIPLLEWEQWRRMSCCFLNPQRKKCRTQ